jgi:mycoredoxin
MKKIFLFVIALLIFQSWPKIHNYFSPPPDYSAAHGGKVVLYATSWCGYCARARDLMNANGIEFVEYDIEKSEEGREQYNRLGGRGIPVLVIKGEVIFGFDESRILALGKKS